MDTKEFSKILYETVIPSNLSMSEQVQKIELLFNYVQKSLPVTLYRYRRCNERNLEAFYKDYFWVSAPTKMNDGFDTRLYINIKELLEKRDQLLGSIKNQWKTVLIQGARLPDLLSSFPAFEQVYQKTISLPEDQIADLITQFCDYLSKEVDFAAEAFISLAQHTMKIGCLSQNMDSSVMWSNYADNETGFVLGYDFRDISAIVSQNTGSIKPFACWPVIYSNERFQVPGDYIEHMIQYRITKQVLNNSGYEYFFPQAANSLLSSFICPDILIPAKIALHKSREWKYEGEYRLFCSESNFSSLSIEPYGYFIMRPTVIYLGRRISSFNEKILTDLAKEKNIPVFKMQLDDSSPRYTLLAKTVNKIL